MKTTETTTEHTPGPWLAGQTITAADPDRAPGSYERITIASRVNNMANARLIAAAPELLLACRALEQAVDLWFNEGSRASGVLRDLRKTLVDDTMMQTRAAIAKATGGAK